MQPHDMDYVSLKRCLTAFELKHFYMATENERACCATLPRLPVTQLACVILLKTFRRLGYGVLFSLAPESLINFIAQYLKHNTWFRNIHQHDKSEAWRKYLADISKVAIYHRYEFTNFNSLSRVARSAREEAVFLSLHVAFFGKN